MSATRRLVIGILLLATIITAGVIGYMIIEGWVFLDALYMTVITITTVGYAEVSPLSQTGQIFSIFLIISGVGGAFYVLSILFGYVIEGHLRTTLGRRRMERNITKLNDHFIVCGYGRVGHEIAKIFAEEKVPFVVIDKNPDSITTAEKENRLFIQADATIDQVLIDAGIERARGLVVAVGDDAASVYITLTARGIKPDLFIDARASGLDVESKLIKAGADRIISPYKIGAQRMAQLALRPGVVDFIENVALRRELLMEHMTVIENSTLIGLTVNEVHRRTKAAVLAISRKSGKLLANPQPEEVIEAGDKIITLGTRTQLAALEEICQRCTV